MTRRKLQLAGALGLGAADKRLEILRRVGKGGSISQAARDAGVSYKAAWQALDTLSNLAGAPLVERSVGGAGGGGARLTSAGEQLLCAAGEMERARQQVLARLGGRGVAGSVSALGLRTSMRNQIPCTVGAITRAGPLVRVEVNFGSPPQNLHARITAESAQLLGLQPGLCVVALCKATAVGVAALPATLAPNQLAGRASRVARGALGDEVAVALDAGTRMVGFARSASRLRAGRRVVVSVEEAALVLALA